MQDIKCKENLTLISEKFLLGLFENTEKSFYNEHLELLRGEIAFFINGGGSTNLIFNGGRYKMPLKEEHYLLIYNPIQDLSFDLSLSGGAKAAMLVISINELHALLMAKTGEIAFLDNDNVNSKYYLEKRFWSRRSF